MTSINTMIEGRRADSARRRQRVIKAINAAGADGGEISVSAIARTAGVDRTFLYRHNDLLGQIHAAQASPAAAEGDGPTVSRASLQADLANAHGQITRQTTRIRQLEKKLSELMGEQAWRESGLGAPADIDQLHRRITNLEQQVVDLRDQLNERDQELDAARAANRELIANLNRSGSGDWSEPPLRRSASTCSSHENELGSTPESSMRGREPST
jgi:septal ring factor EnvC (AmiA/AmiB activator)